MRWIIDKTGITIIGDQDEIIMVGAGDTAYEVIRAYLVDGGQDIDRIRQLTHDGKGAIRQLVAEVRDAVDADTSYRVKHGDPVDAVVLAAAVRVRREGGDLTAFGAFTRRLEANPSPESRSQLFAWLAAGGFTLTSDGLIVGYKGVGDDGRSLFCGRENVTIDHQDGAVDTVMGHVPYPVGATASMDRALVNDDRDEECAPGLHVGTYRYAVGYGPQTILVFVDPADVVAVPRHSAQKMRVCKLFVAAQHDGDQISETVLATVKTVADEAAHAAYRARPENQPPEHSDYGDDYCYDDEESVAEEDFDDGDEDAVGSKSDFATVV